MASGLTGIGLILLSFYLYPLISPPSEHPDVVEGWAAGVFILIAMAIALFISGALSVFLTFRDLSSLKYAIYVSICSGSIASLLSFLIALILATYAFGLFVLCFGTILASILLAVLGGLSTYFLLSFLRRRTSL